ncbi:hypothetical protein RAN7_4779 [plant metagenome]|uniref:Uncharacterized protein n=1 Tax=plant metagenome TaxID=1297885 RepID=A0A484YAB4_9ZZZZ
MGDLRVGALVPGLLLSDLEGTPVLQTARRSSEERARGVTSNNEYTFDPARKFDVLLMRAVQLGKLPFTLNAETRVEPARVDADVGPPLHCAILVRLIWLCGWLPCLRDAGKWIGSRP